MSTIVGPISCTGHLAQMSADSVFFVSEDGRLASTVGCNRSSRSVEPQTRRSLHARTSRLARFPGAPEGPVSHPSGLGDGLRTGTAGMCAVRDTCT